MSDYICILCYFAQNKSRATSSSVAYIKCIFIIGMLAYNNNIELVNFLILMIKDIINCGFNLRCN